MFVGSKVEEHQIRTNLHVVVGADVAGLEEGFGEDGDIVARNGSHVAFTLHHGGCEDCTGNAHVWRLSHAAGGLASEARAQVVPMDCQM